MKRPCVFRTTPYPRTVCLVAQRLLLVLRERTVPLLFPPSNIRDYTVPWHPDGVSLTHHRDHVLQYCADVQVRVSSSLRCCDPTAAWGDGLRSHAAVWAARARLPHSGARTPPGPVRGARKAAVSFGHRLDRGATPLLFFEGGTHSPPCRRMWGRASSVAGLLGGSDHGWPAAAGALRCAGAV
jgi:hypothetical protein